MPEGFPGLPGSAANTCGSESWCPGRLAASRFARGPSCYQHSAFIDDEIICEGEDRGKSEGVGPCRKAEERNKPLSCVKRRPARIAISLRRIRVASKFPA
jgi:hypothetical protein